ncbi:MAG: hypothetical protein M0Z82_14520 [Actinomycetota bacterium]|nr:hypothetical protein [Actinomycetota bacterium]
MHEGVADADPDVLTVAGAGAEGVPSAEHAHSRGRRIARTLLIEVEGTALQT